MAHKTPPVHPLHRRTQSEQNLMQPQFSPDPYHPLAAVQTSQTVLFYLEKKKTVKFKRLIDIRS